MSKRDPRVDAYIAKAPDFARPVLSHVRALVHQARPDIEETMKWSVPHFEHRGVLCGMAAFRQHCNIILWKGALIPGGKGRDEKGNFRNVTSLADLPSDKSMVALFKEAARLNEDGVKRPPRKRATGAGKPLPLPAELVSALARNRKAAAAFEKFPPSHKREYARWIAEAKGEDTRQRRVKSAIEWIAAGKSRNWKYER